MTPLDYALKYAEQGFAVFPAYSIQEGECTCGNPTCSSAGKHPMIAGGFKAASTDPDTIQQWWTDWPNANVAIATGSISNLFVLDVDIGEEKQGEAALERLEAEIGPLPRDAVVQTGSGGYHIYMQMPDQPIRGNAGKLGPNLDVRADGGYVIAPPSTHISGNSYTWENTNA
ncbi:bifunctional DNA primase/polymerase [Pontibaca salina]|uniref:Bifunctional DNA primase/polymerase n=1 Tax=Pontibaca salina TaxID=2795731 RepID=A0A934HNQ1_9RHOB|nr:bifunctional DNA primase/polymerase [Pontibaca salina]MBI6630361.1 bifunctional DNA primase/polymerase [Pontibaca salina]